MSESASDIQRFMRNLAAQYAQIADQNSELDAKISALNAAIKEAKRGRDDTRDLVRKLPKTPVADTWKGRRRNGYEDAKGNAILSEAKAYLQGIESMIDQMKKSKWNFESQRAGNLASLLSIRKNYERWEAALRQTLEEQRASSGGSSW